MSLAYMQLNGSGFVSNSVYMYNREENTGYGTAGMSLLLNLSAGDSVRVLARREHGSDTVRLNSNSGITMIKL